VCCIAFFLQEPEDPDDKAVPVGDKSQLDYAAGGEDEQPKDEEGGDKQQPQAQEQGGEEEPQQAPQPAVEEEQEEEEDMGDYQDRCGGAGQYSGSASAAQWQYRDNIKCKSSSVAPRCSAAAAECVSTHPSVFSPCLTAPCLPTCLPACLLQARGPGPCAARGCRARLSAARRPQP
jgi:hypothetical protein